MWENNREWFSISIVSLSHSRSLSSVCVCARARVCVCMCACRCKRGRGGGPFFSVHTSNTRRRTKTVELRRFDNTPRIQNLRDEVMSRRFHFGRLKPLFYTSLEFSEFTFLLFVFTHHTLSLMVTFSLFAPSPDSNWRMSKLRLNICSIIKHLDQIMEIRYAIWRASL